MDFIWKIIIDWISAFLGAESIEPDGNADADATDAGAADARPDADQPFAQSS